MEPLCNILVSLPFFSNCCVGGPDRLVASAGWNQPKLVGIFLDWASLSVN